MKKAIQWVLSIHCILLILLFGDHWVKRKKPAQKALSIRSVQIQSQKPLVAQSSPAPKPKSLKPPIQSKAKKNAPAKKAPSSTPSSIKTQPTEEKKPELAVPTLPPLLVPAIEEEKPNPHLVLASFLQEQLQLPEFGEVKVELSIHANGIVASIEILESKSRKNEEFLKNRLAEMSFPWLNGETKLTLVFRNDDGS